MISHLHCLTWGQLRSKSSPLAVGGLVIWSDLRVERLYGCWIQHHLYCTWPYNCPTWHVSDSILIFHYRPGQYRSFSEGCPCRLLQGQMRLAKVGVNTTPMPAANSRSTLMFEVATHAMSLPKPSVIFRDFTPTGQTKVS